MQEPHVAMPEGDPRFPSGPWTGFFLQYFHPGRNTTKCELMAAGGQLTATGHDFVGSYTMDGSYDLASGRCEWTKKYTGKHRVSYRGVNDGHGIWGVWEIRLLGGLYQDRGGFHIWPEGSDVSEESARTEQVVREIMQEEFGNHMSSVYRVIALAIVVGIAASCLWLWHWRY